MAEESLVNAMTNLYLNPKIADLTLIIDGERLPAHRTILAANNEYFRALLFGHFGESNKNEIQLDVNSKAFKPILKYIYLRSFDITEHDDDLKNEIINLAAEYGCMNLVTQSLERMHKRLNYSNFANILNLALLHNIKTVYEKLLDFVDNYTSQIFGDTHVLSFTKEALIAIIQRDSFVLDELKIFQAVLKWAKEQPRNDLKEVLCHVRFVLMQISEIRKFVELENLFETEEIDDMIEQIKTSNCLPYRNKKIHRTQMDFELMETSKNYGYTWKWQRSKFPGPTLFKLSSERMINHICILLGSYDSRVSYYIEISRDGREWTRVVDYTDYECYYKQFLYFDVQPINFVYFMPTYWPEEAKLNLKELAITEFEVDFKQVSLPIMMNDIVAPRFNMLDISGCAKDAGPYDKNLLGTQRRSLSDNPLLLIETWFQPIYANSLYFKATDDDCKIESIEVKTSSHDYFKHIDFQSDFLGTNYCFEAQVIYEYKITLTQKALGSVYGFYYNVGKLNLPR